MPDTSAISVSGLFMRDNAHTAVPLAGVSIEAEINGFCARVAVAHRYVNRETTPIEAVYVFPLSEGAAVCGFEAVVDGTLVVGEVQEREKAFETYDEAMEQGHGAFLLDEERPDIFQASVGNLLPGKEVLVRLTYVTELAIDAGRVRFTIPTTVSPRYAPGADRTGVGRPDAQALNPPVAWTVPYGLDLSMRIAMPGRVMAIESPSHPIALTINEHDATVTLAQNQAALDRDFVLAIQAAETDSPQALIERGDDGHETVAVSFVPAFTETTAPAEVIFVVDRSGSMGGTSIQEVRNALQLCLRSMISGCRFNIIGFGATYESLFSETRVYDQTSLDAADKHVANLRANLGGTEILPALKFALEQPRDAELPRQIFVLTDGQVSNTDAVLALVAAHAADTRLFTFGIGAGASEHLVRGLARAGGGTAEFIYPGERIEPKVVRQFGRLLSPALTDVKIDWSGAPVTSMPAKVPPVFAGSRLLVYGFPRGERPNAVRLSARGSAGPLSFEVRLAGARVATGKSVATLAARARIRELEESAEWLATRGSRQTDRKQSSARSEVIELSVRHGLISRQTSFVAVERRETPVHGDIKLRRVPIALTTGWGGMQERVGGLLLSGSRPYMDGARVMLDSPEMSALSLGAPPPPRSARGVTGRILGGWLGSARSGPTPTIGPSSGMHALVALQQWDGHWELTRDLAVILDREVTEIEAAIGHIRGRDSDRRRLWATALAIAWLELRAGDAEEEWKLLRRKAEEWIDSVPVRLEGGMTWTAAAKRFLTA